MSDSISMLRPKSGPSSLPSDETRPRHVAIIMDGNGRWATEQGLPRIEGHRRGAETVRDITTYCREIGIRYLTLYSFSVQNWQRPEAEVLGLMNLLEEYCREQRALFMRNEIRLSTIGRLDRLPPTTRLALEELSAETRGHQKMTLTLAVDYGAREELLKAMVDLAMEIKDGKRHPNSLDESSLIDKLYTATLPDPDLVIRTSGELRLSNFLLWQNAYAELYFTEVLWPSFTRKDFAAALWDYANRQRRFGGIDGKSNVVEKLKSTKLASQLAKTKG